MRQKYLAFLPTHTEEPLAQLACPLQPNRRASKCGRRASLREVVSQSSSLPQVKAHKGLKITLNRAEITCSDQVNLISLRRAVARQLWMCFPEKAWWWLLGNHRCTSLQLPDSSIASTNIEKWHSSHLPPSENDVFCPAPQPLMCTGIESGFGVQGLGSASSENV